MAAQLQPLDIGRAPEGGEVGAVQSGWRLALRQFAGNRPAVIGLGVVLFFIGFSWLGPVLYHTDQVTTSLGLANLAPSGSHLLGTDANGFDELGRMMKGGQAALEIGAFAALVAITLGMLIGSVAGLAGGVVDGLLMRVTDVFLSVPLLFVVLIMAVKFGATVLSLSLLIGGFVWPVPARLVRGEVLTLRTRDFVLAARTAGSGRARLIVRHLLPNAFGVIIVNVTFQMVDAIILVSSIGYLGFGLHFPNVDWGDQLSNSVNFLQDGYWWQIFPVGACIVLTVMALNFIGDALRDAMDVRLRRR